MRSLHIPFRLLLAASFLALVSAVSQGQSSFPKPDRLRYDGQCLTLGGKDIFIYSGSFHYFRCPRELWRDRFRKIKEAGFNTVDTYVPWNWHEKEKPAALEDTSKIDLSALVEWLKMAHEEFGLYTIIRPGPYICAEWDGGGFPRWLLALKTENMAAKLWLRSDDPTYLAWSRHWMDAVCKVVAPEQVTRKPIGKAGVILFQIENEYNFYRVGDPAKMAHMRTLYRDARQAGIEVPIFGNLTKEARSNKDPDLKNIFDGVDTYPNFKTQDMIRQLKNLRREQPHAPVMLPELQGGWFSQVGGQLSEDSGLNAVQITHITLLAIEMDTTILNYYMLFGGTNFENWFGRMGRAAVTSYDYNAPIRECGGVGERYAAVKAMGLMLKEHGAVLARSKQVESKAATGSPDVTVTVRKGADGQSFIFCRNNSAKEARAGHASVGIGSKQFTFDYNFGPFEARILRLPPDATDTANGEWLPKSVALPERPEITAKAVRIAQAQMLVDDTVSSWRAVKPGQLLPSLGVYDSRTVLYRAVLQLTANDIAQKPLLELQVDEAGNVAVRVNGRLYTEGKRNGGKLCFNVGEALKPGKNEIILQYESTGQENIGPAINNTPGIAAAGFMDSVSDGGVSLSHWTVRLLKDGELPVPFVGVDTDETGWQTFVLDQKTVQNLQAAALPGAAAPADKAAGLLYGINATAVFRCGFELDESKAKATDLSLLIPTINDHGEVFLNGQSVGKSTDWSKPFKANLHGKVKAGRNVLAIVITNKGFAGGLLKTPVLSLKTSGAKALEIELGEPLNGETRLGWTTTAPTGDWKSVALETVKPIARKRDGTPQGKAENLQTWYRMEFELPEPQPGVWVPWQAVLDASGCGTIFVNGHHLGRYWQAGPQRAFFIPECWLKFGKGNRNILSMGLRSTAQGAVLRAAEITPCPEYAEKRAP